MKKLTFNPKKFSKKHHYLPVFYLKGFTDTDGKLWVYDKLRDTIEAGFDPKSIFFQNHLNNYKFEGKVHFTLEESIFSDLDDKASFIFHKIRNLKIEQDNQINWEEKFELIIFLSRLYWRLPFTDHIFVDLIKKEGLCNKHFGFKINGEVEFLHDNDILSIKEQFLIDKEIQKISKHTVPLSNASIEEVYSLGQKWNLFYITLEGTQFITGDNPFLINNSNLRLDNIFNELIFPICKNKILILSEKAPSFIEGNLVGYINQSILNQAERFVASDNENQLNEIRETYLRLSRQGIESVKAHDTFDLLKHQASFKTYKDWCNAYYEIKRRNSELRP